MFTIRGKETENEKENEERHKKEMDKALRKQIKAELSSLMKMTRKFNYETASSKEIQKIRDSKKHLESLAQNIIGR